MRKNYKNISQKKQNEKKAPLKMKKKKVFPQTIGDWIKS